MVKKRKRKSKYMYGKLYDDTFEFRTELNDLFRPRINNASHAGNFELANDLVKLRNQVKSLFRSFVGSKKLESKFGIKIPLNSTPISIEKFLERQGRSAHKIYIPCEICGENRISNFCHIVPRQYGGTDDEKNYVYLCPTHHHLFDHNRLSKEEWQKIDFSKKLEPAREYANKIRLPFLKKFW